MLRFMFALATLVLAYIPTYAYAEAEPQLGDPEYQCTGEVPTKLHDPVFVKGTKAAMFPTRIKQGMADGVNFCSRYTLVSIGFTGPYQVNFIVNRKTGQIHEVPLSHTAIEAVNGSSLLILNGNIEDFADDDGIIPEWLFREFYVFTGSEFVLIRSDRGPSSGEAQVSNTELLDTPHPVHPSILKEMDASGELQSIVDEICDKDSSGALCN